MTLAIVVTCTSILFYSTVTCQEPVHENSTTIRNTISSPLYFEEHEISYACRKNYFHANGSLSRVCNNSGDWTENQPVCKRE